MPKKTANPVKKSVKTAAKPTKPKPKPSKSAKTAPKPKRASKAKSTKAPPPADGDTAHDLETATPPQPVEASKAAKPAAKPKAGKAVKAAKAVKAKAAGKGKTSKVAPAPAVAQGKASDDDADSTQEDFVDAVAESAAVPKQKRAAAPKKKKAVKRGRGGDGDSGDTSSPNTKKGRASAGGGGQGGAKKKKKGGSASSTAAADVDDMGDAADAATAPRAARKVPKIKFPRGVYIQFCLDFRPKFVEQHPDIPFSQLGRKMGEAFRSLSEEEMDKYRLRAEEDKKRFLRECEEHDYTPCTRRHVSAKTGKRFAPRDPTKPKRPMIAYTCFYTEKFPEVSQRMQSETSERVPVTQVAKRIGSMWQDAKADEATKAKYDALAIEDKARYEREMADWRPLQICDDAEMEE